MFKNSSFLFLWGGQASSNFGDRLYMLAIITFIYKATDSALLASVVPFIRLSMQLVSSLLTPIVTQKLRLKTILALSQLIQSGLLLVLIVFLTYFGSSFTFIVVTISLLSFLHSWIFPLKSAILPKLVQNYELVKANSILSITDQAFALFGWVGGGILLSKFGSVFVLSITCALFFLSTGLFSLIRISSSEQLKKKKRLTWDVILEGWRYIIKEPLYRRLFVVGSFQSIAGSVWVGAIILIFVKEILHKNESWWGFLNGAWLLGTIVGGVILSKWIQKRLSVSLIMGLLLNGVMIILYASCSIPLLALGIAFLIGIPYQIHDVAKRTLLQVNAKSGKLTQIFAAYQAVGSVFFGLGIFMMNLLVDVYGVQVVYYLSAMFTLVSAWLARGVLKLTREGGL